MTALFDLTFRKFVTPTVVKIIYVLAMVVIGLVYLAISVAAFQANSGLGIFVLLILGPAVALFYLTIFRVLLEAGIAIIYTAQNTATLVSMGGGVPAGGPTIAPPAYGAPPQPYGAQYPPAPPGGYGQSTPPGGYGQAPPQGGYGQPPEQGGYGQPGQQGQYPQN